MPICIHCRHPIATLYTTYSKADDRALGKGVRLTQCPECKNFADKYVEHDFVILFIDLVLIKPEVRTHTPCPLPHICDRSDNVLIRDLVTRSTDIFSTIACTLHLGHSTGLLFVLRFSCCCLMSILHGRASKSWVYRKVHRIIPRPCHITYQHQHHFSLPTMG